ncbi:hypothetical protein QJS10_CPA05g00523 [Acorus calamus]|uniref:Uncharacterized protein n=1 Tax=Acorus calamus TaxID=4465 RepID=A0AAV9EWB2_ACOCL|nr:hypothetical protein QJS10_CPA05g00523 [Acorus calamus]
MNRTERFQCPAVYARRLVGWRETANNIQEKTVFLNLRVSKHVVLLGGHRERLMEKTTSFTLGCIRHPNCCCSSSSKILSFFLKNAETMNRTERFQCPVVYARRFVGWRETANNIQEKTVFLNFRVSKHVVL